MCHHLRQGLELKATYIEWTDVLEVFRYRFPFISLYNMNKICSTENHVKLKHNTRNM